MRNSVKKIVICIFDGLRPDRLSRDVTPNLWEFTHQGIWYRQCRSVFPSMTRVAGVSFATGSKPQTHGIVDNVFYFPPLFNDHPLDTSDYVQLRAAEAKCPGAFVQAPGLGCALAAAKKSYFVVHTGSAGSAYMVNHRARHHRHWTFSVHGREKTQTPEAVDEMTRRFGPLPSTVLPQTCEVDYGARVFIEHVLPVARPDVSLIWFVEPDSTYHYHHIGSQPADDISRHVDRHFGTILDTIRDQPDGEQTLIIAMSDHGHITTTEECDLVAMLNDAGFRAGYRPSPETEIIVSKGRAVALRLAEQAGGRGDAVVEALLDSALTGMVFSSPRITGNGPLKGTFSLATAGLDHDRSPDLVWVGHSSNAADDYGLPGAGIISGSGIVPLGGGMHGGLNRYELNCLLAFGGAGLPSLGPIDDPADITDIVPTLLSVLRCNIPETATGSPLAAILDQERPELFQKRWTVERGSYAQELVFDHSGIHPVLLYGGRLT